MNECKRSTSIRENRGDNENQMGLLSENRSLSVRMSHVRFKRASEAVMVIVPCVTRIMHGAYYEKLMVVLFQPICIAEGSSGTSCDKASN